MSRAIYGEIEGAFGRSISARPGGRCVEFDTSDGEYSTIPAKFCPNCGHPIELVNDGFGGRILEGIVKLRTVINEEDGGGATSIHIGGHPFELDDILEDGKRYEIMVRRLE